MLIQIPSLLSQQQLSAIQNMLNSAEFIDGKLSAGKMAETVKLNQEIASSNPVLNQLNKIVMNSLVKHTTYIGATFPKSIASPFYAKYTRGMAYGDHIDDPLMGSQGQHYRTDISITIFLNSPSDYDGGELVINDKFGQQHVKLNAGDAVMYPSSSIHHINQVTAGERLVAVTWAQSMVRSTEQRALLYELGQARDQLLLDNPDSEITTQINNSYANLLRMWADI
ncbi:PKHD-type hydroxylase YbiX [hydrothermal vent metagenome]|uniref:PKHD-type hydroxylase YbiX n=1 Tax=hydrothermal vent metagenome TaxID=652676 RepID=A0A3B1A269_9ZZZZ